MSIVRGYFRRILEILTRPRSFFGALPSEGGTGKALAFALVTHWIASALGFLSRSALNDLWLGVSERMRHLSPGTSEAEIYTFRSSSLPQLHEWSEGFSHWLWSAGSVVADPFLTLMRLILVSTVVWVGARILIDPQSGHAGSRKVDWESILRISSYAMAASIFSVIPVAGTGLSQLGILILTVIGIQEYFRVSTLRAIVVAVFPTLLIAGALLIGIFFFGFLIFKLFIFNH